MKKIKVLNFDALSYSGTTWLNLLLGSHDDTLTIGPPHGLWDARDTNIGGICQVHGKKCGFWSKFDEIWDRDENLFVALHSFSGKSIFIMDNAPAEVIEQATSHPDVELLLGRYIRDARAITASYVRKMASKGVSYVDSIQPSGWFYGSFQAIPDLKEMEQDQILVARYEEAVADQSEFLRKAGDFLGITYSESTNRFWEWEHHITSGNQGPIAMVKLAQGEPVGSFESKEVYERQLERLKQDPANAFNDERWKEQLTTIERAEFDRLMGIKNGSLGYERDFSKPATGIQQRVKVLTARNIETVKRVLRGSIFAKTVKPIIALLKNKRN